VRSVFLTFFFFCFFEKIERKEKINMSALRVAVTGAAGAIAYSLLPQLASGDVFVK
jgi:hypothetical protein